ncbi:hypothetical protein BC938DRAFT_477914 [Jimgerdemannia flammicorona]|uniref:Uncharacterized protein n=1 Tax=Jimgerdemannia flammicorona TaxID=994334 RepID=A0A433QNM7_9FUNG|nr:hypothetical protein BC938DRAFT_477914 [Jimgerdemannia flammicorona]
MLHLEESRVTEAASGWAVTDLSRAAGFSFVESASVKVVVGAFSVAREVFTCCSWEKLREGWSKVSNRLALIAEAAFGAL